MESPGCASRCAQYNEFTCHLIPRRHNALNAMKKFLILLFLNPLLSEAAVEAFEVGPNNTDQLPKGKEADGIIGDFILRNGFITAVISGNQPLRRPNMSTFYGNGGITPGCLYDLTLNYRENDQLTIFAPGSQRGDVSHVRVLEAGDAKAKTAAIEVVVDAARNNGLYKRHVYRLDGIESGLTITTTYRNDSQQIRRGTVDDYWKPSGRKGTFRNMRWIESVDPDDHQAYAVAWLENGSIVGPPGPLALKPGETRTFTRYLTVGDSPADAVSNFFDHKHDISKTYVLDATFPDDRINGKTIRVKYHLIHKGQKLPGSSEFVANRNYSILKLPVGEYELEVANRGRKTVKGKLKFGLNICNATFALSPLSGVAFAITDAAGKDTPCKVQFIGTGKTATPNLGPQNRAHGCVDQWHSETGKFNVALDPGTYRLVITRGIEHNHLVREVTVKTGAFTPVKGALQRVVNTRGWVSTDFHNHSTPSGDNQCGTDDRIINLAAEHIEFAPTTEHNRIYDWAPHIKKLGLAEHLSTVIGLELTGAGAGSHHNAFPLPAPKPFAQDGGAPVFQNDPRLNAISLQNFGGWNPDRWVHVNHPHLTEKFWDRNLDGQADGGFRSYEKYIHALETQNYLGNDILATAPWKLARRGTSESVREVREFVWLQMLNQGHRIPAIAVADAHSVYGNGVGGWRTYIPSSTDAPAKIDPKEIIRHAKAGRLMLTTGPFLQVTHRDSGPGDTVVAKGRAVTLKVKVQCADWVEIDRVQILVSGRQALEYNFTRQSHPKFFGNGVVKFDRAIEVKLTEDAHLIVVAMGEHSTMKTGYGTSSYAGLKPCAYINPIWVDVDGGGFKHNGDTLGWDLPVGRQNPKTIRALLKAKGE